MTYVYHDILYLGTENCRELGNGIVMHWNNTLNIVVIAPNTKRNCCVYFTYKSDISRLEQFKFDSQDTINDVEETIYYRMQSIRADYGLVCHFSNSKTPYFVPSSDYSIPSDFWFQKSQNCFYEVTSSMLIKSDEKLTSLVERPQDCHSRRFSGPYSVYMTRDEKWLLHIGSMVVQFCDPGTLEVIEIIDIEYPMEHITETKDGALFLSLFGGEVIKIEFSPDHGIHFETCPFSQNGLELYILSFWENHFVSHDIVGSRFQVTQLNDSIFVASDSLKFDQDIVAFCANEDYLYVLASDQEFGLALHILKVHLPIPKLKIMLDQAIQRDLSFSYS